MKEEYIYNHGTCKDNPLHFTVDTDDKDKIIVVATAKNESKYAKEWVEHYLNLDFDKIFIFDNNELGDDSLYENIKEYVDKELVQIFDVRGVKSLPGECYQDDIYTSLLQKRLFKWALVVDLDEYLELHAYKSIKQYLDTIPDEIDIVGFHWLMYGSDNQLTYNNQPLKERFKSPVKPIAYTLDNGFTKCLVRNNDNIDKGIVGCHYPHYPENNINECIKKYGDILLYMSGRATSIYDIKSLHYPLIYKDGYIKHYYTKSFDEFVEKIDRSFCYDKKSYKTFEYYTNKEFNSVDHIGSTSYNSIDYYNSSQFVSNLKSINSKIIYLKSNQNVNVISTIYSMMQIMKTAYDNKLDFVWMFDHKNMDEHLYLILMELALELNTDIIGLSDNEEIRKYQIYNIAVKYGSQSYNIINC